MLGPDTPPDWSGRFGSPVPGQGGCPGTGAWAGVYL